MPRAPRSSLAKHWCFTYNNPTETPQLFQQAIDDGWDSEYCSFQEEMSDSGTPHYQGYVEFKTRKRLTQLKKLPHGATIHWETRKGSRQEARDYSQKDETRVSGPYEIGIFPSSAQGKRSDLLTACDTLRTAGLRAVAQEHPSTFVRYHRGLRALLNIETPTRDAPPTVTLLYGPPDCGKTRHVREAETPDDLWCAPPDAAMRWFDGYVGQPAALFDDFDGKASKVPLTSTLQTLDRYAIREPIKGDYCPWNPSRIYVTTNYHPKEWYDFTARAAQYPALARRFTHVLHWAEISPGTIECHSICRDDEPELWKLFWQL